MKSNVKRLFAGPYILWMIGFTIIPLLLIVYYGLTTKSGAFTLANVCSITTPEHMKAFIEILKDRNINVTVRRRLGPDIDASCGQLRRAQMKHAR